MSESTITPDDTLPKYTPKRLRTIRKRDLGLNMEQLAEKVGCDARTIQRCETGRSPIRPELIRKVEKLRAEAREARAREESADQIDFNSAPLPPGMTLVELVPVSKLLGTLTRIFAAVPKETLPPSGTGEQPSPAPASRHSASSGSAFSPAASVTRAEFRVIAVGLCAVILGSVSVLRDEIRITLRGVRGARFARDARVERPAEMHQPRSPQGEAQEPEQAPMDLYTDGASPATGDAGTKAKRSIPMPKQFYKWQKGAPCEPGETEKVGGCWLELAKHHPPCPRYAVEDEQHLCLAHSRRTQAPELCRIQEVTGGSRHQREHSPQRGCRTSYNRPRNERIASRPARVEERFQEVPDEAARGVAAIPTPQVHGQHAPQDALPTYGAGLDEVLVIPHSREDWVKLSCLLSRNLTARAKTRMLTRLKIHGFKNLVDVDVSFGPFTCVAGGNGVGKSNLFDALEFLAALADKPLLEAAQSVRSEGGVAGDINGIFHHVGSTYADEMSFEVEMLVPPRGVDDLGQIAMAAITFLKYSLVLGRRHQEEGRGSSSNLEIRKEELVHIKMDEANRHLPFPHSTKWRKSVASGRRTSAFISTETTSQTRHIKLHQDGGKVGRTRLFLAQSLPRTVLSSANASESPTALLARREMQSWRLLQLEPSALRSPDRYNAPSRIATSGAHLPATLNRLAKARKGDFPEETESVYARVANRLAGSSKASRPFASRRMIAVSSIHLSSRTGMEPSTKHGRCPTEPSGSSRWLCSQMILKHRDFCASRNRRMASIRSAFQPCWSCFRVSPWTRIFPRGPTTRSGR